MKNNSKNIEEILLNNYSYEEMIKTKIEKDFQEDLVNAKLPTETKFITNIKDVPNEKLFSKFAVYEILNKNSKTKSFINGIQAEGFLGSQNTIREKLFSGETDSFISGNCYIKFSKIKI